ncbi:MULTISPECIES: hypothetical protein [Vibrio]|uniref:Uncharacterized protein n=1 Tax=Vibrio tasmaniensis TaxID=212663 RepID=A0A2N7NMV4_9VIBR|nr:MULTISPECIES: hypothetical protein [Vibrio]EAQ55472.1 hypothetical protein MED222_08628 [Vibrio sp. MED222]PMP17272.1 hypothetical protein BCS92_06135 [Vibrio tasmaniensis]TKG33676.1 hypothetical protein FC057_11150 [Vibrio tasmaniensis]TKG43535.1 hypothetical protein FC063_01840 [Vibrio tasmaniensis]TKG46617.1 hypothetical protein FC060_12685 [Vibrio tasmaniensis]
MNMRVLIGLIATFIGLFAMIYLIAGGTQFPIYQWPQEAYLGLVFSVVWGTGVAASVAYVFSALVFVTVAVVCYAIGYKSGGLFSSNSDV